MSPQGDYISDLDALTSIGLLAGGLLEMDVLAGPVAGAYVSRRVTTEQYIAYLAGKGFTTTLPAKQTWRYRTRAEADADGFGGEVMEEVDWNKVYGYQRGFVEFWRDVPTDLSEVPRPQDLIAVYSPNPAAKQGWRTSGGAAGNAGRIGLRWVFLTDPAATGVYEFQANQPIKAGQVRFATDEQGAFFAQARIDLDPEVPHPVRGVTTVVWKPITPPPVPGGQYSDAQAQDAAATLFTAGGHTGISFSYDAAEKKITATVTATGSVQSVNGVAPDAAGNVNLPTLDRYDVPQAVRDAVLAGSFGSGELQGAQPAGSLAGQRFTSATYGYEYERGAGGGLVWCRYPKG